ncbi:MAG: PIG-L family deacetylase [Spirochaetales bacterium]
MSIVLYVGLSLGFFLFTLVYFYYFLPLRKRPSRFRTQTEQKSLFVLYYQGKYKGEIYLPWRTLILGFDSTSDLPLNQILPPQEYGGTFPSRIELQPTGNYFRVTSDVPVLLQGIARTTGWLLPNGVLRIGPIKVVFKGIEEVKGRVRVPPSYLSYASLYGPGLIGGVLGGVFLLMGLIPSFSISTSPLSPPPTSFSLNLEPKANTSLKPLKEDLGPAADPVNMSLTKDTTLGSATASIAKKETPNTLEPALFSQSSLPPLPQIVPPGGKLPSIPIQVLFLHAHPDDESIEFGTLMARCTLKGIPTGMVIFTDGEGGIFASEYKGPRTELPQIRIQEAAWALHTLGSSLYIRLGLSNQPYNSVRDEQKAEQVLKRWGNKTLEKVVEILLTYQPQVVVSPEKPSSVRKHFEHEATALLVSRAIEKVRARGYTFPRGYLQSLDPRHIGQYQQKLSFSRSEVAALQKKALSYHRTQADAFHFGVQRVEQFPFEYYRVEFWELPLPPNEYF